MIRGGNGNRRGGRGVGEKKGPVKRRNSFESGKPSGGCKGRKVPGFAILSQSYRGGGVYRTASKDDI